MKNNHFNKYSLIGKAIKEERTLRGLSQNELALRIGISKSYLSKIEAPNCNKAFSLELIFDLAEELEIPITQLFKYLH